jgi:DNA-binding GntR family transcriptional regulator
MSGQLPPGERLVYRTLASEMGVSPTPVRDAVHRLVSDGVLEMGDRGTASLPRLDPDRFVEIITLRIELEGRAATAVAAHGGPKIAAELAELNAGMESARACGDQHKTLDLNE